MLDFFIRYDSYFVFLEFDDRVIVEFLQGVKIHTLSESDAIVYYSFVYFIKVYL